MIVLPLGLSLSKSATEAGAIAAFAALVGIAVLSLLVFSQAREIKRLREWAGRAPERAAEMEQRVSADAAARLQRAATPAAARVIPRKTPLVSAPVSSAVNATVASAAAAGPAAPAKPATAAGAQTPAGLSTSTDSSGEPAGAPGAEAGPAGGTTGQPMTEAPIPPAVQQKQAVGDVGTPEPEETAPGSVQDLTTAARALPAEPAVPGLTDGTDATGPSDAPAGDRAEGETKSAVEPSATTPATAAARAGGVPGRSALPPSPAKPAPPGVSSPATPPGGPTPAGEPPGPAPRQALPVAAARRMPTRAVSGAAADVLSRSPVPPRARIAASTASGGGARTVSPRGPGAPVGGGGPKYFKPGRSSGRAAALIAGGVVVGALVLVLAVSVLKGGGASTATQRSSAAETQPVEAQKTSTTSHTVASNPAETAVAVLNGTATTGLAHHLAADLQQEGYTHAVALAGVPPGTHASTVVQYAHGHRADAQAIAKALNVAHVQAIETTIASLAGSATVVVLAGTDQASQLGGGGAQSNGEPAATAGSGQ